MPNKPIISHSLAETSNLAEQWLGNLDTDAGNVGKNGEAVVVALNGHLGSGKTTFVQAVARALGVGGYITSPTFVLMKKYDLGERGSLKKDARFKTLIHIDAYRLENGGDLEALEFEKLVANPENLILIEWADNVKDGLPENIKKIGFEYVSGNERQITFSN
jgi:tRNA threonylcarbamoyladenosine biosynthesis protein TsaE